MKLLKYSCLLGCILSTYFLCGLYPASAQETSNGLQSEMQPIQIGMSTDLSGSAKTSGQGMKTGIQIYFDKINAEGGIQGHKLKLITLDDQYDPIHAGQNDRQLIEKDKVIALMGNVGSPTAAITVPIVNEMKVLMFAARSGASVLYKNPPDRYVISLRANYADEAAATVRGLLAAGIKPDEIAFFTQNDAFGDAVYNGAMKALKESGYNNPESLPYGRYERNTENIIGALGEIVQEAKKPIRAFIMAGLYEANAKFIHLARTQYPNAIYICASGLIHASDLDKEDDNKIIATQVVPHLNSDLPAVHEYLADMKKYAANGAKPDIASLEGYLDAKLFVIALKQAVAKNQLTREGIIDVLESMHNVDLGIGINISFDKNHHAGLQEIWVTIFDNGQFVPLDWKNLRSKLRVSPAVK